MTNNLYPNSRVHPLSRKTPTVCLTLGLSLLWLCVWGRAAEPGTPEYIHNSPYTDQQVLDLTYPTQRLDDSASRVPQDNATRYEGFSPRLGTWLPTDNYRWWNFDPSNRAEAQDAYFNIVKKADEVPLTWSGSIEKLDPGTINKEYREAVYRFLNWYRYLTYGAKHVSYVFEAPEMLPLVQAAALVQAANNKYLTHTPPPDWKGYSDLARQGSYNSNLSADWQTIFAAWNSFFVDAGNNYPGHRDSLLKIAATRAAVGTVLWDKSDNFGCGAGWMQEPFRYTTRERDPLKCVAVYPTPGYVPCNLLRDAEFDSYVLCFSINFTSGNAQMHEISSIRPRVFRDGVELPVKKTLPGGNSLYFWVDIGNGSKSGDANFEGQFTTSKFGADQHYEVVFENILFDGSATPYFPGDDSWVDPIAFTTRNWSYKFTIYNPERVTATPLQSASQILGLSTRGTIGQGDKVLISGLYVTGDEPVRVLFRAQGPSLQGGVTKPASNPKLVLHQYLGPGSDKVLGANDAWKDSANWRMVESFGFAPADDKEAAAVATLAPGIYSAVVDDAGAGGIGIVEAYAVDAKSASQLTGVSTRGIVGTGEQSLIAGMILQKETTLVLRAVGPSLKGMISDTAAEDPVLHIINMADHKEVAANDDWENDPANARFKTDLAAFAPLHAKEAARVIKLPAGAYSVIVEAKGAPGIGMVEAYRVDD